VQGHGKDCEVNLRSMGYNVDQRMAVLGPQLHEGVPLVHARPRRGFRCGPRSAGSRPISPGALPGCVEPNPGTSSSRRRAALALG
jgi:hypothetical protein